jgi:hypothetical protein
MNMKKTKSEKCPRCGGIDSLRRYKRLVSSITEVIANCRMCRGNFIAGRTTDRLDALERSLSRARRAHDAHRCASITSMAEEEALTHGLLDEAIERGLIG